MVNLIKNLKHVIQIVTKQFLKMLLQNFKKIGRKYFMRIKSNSKEDVNIKSLDTLHFL